jgi:2-methylcitrate dehydratase
MAESTKSTKLGHCDNCYWKNLMLVPHDYAPDAIVNKKTRALMEKFSFTHGGPEYDRRYPDGIPTSLVIEMTDGTKFDSGLVMYPAGHARNATADLKGILARKAQLLGALASDAANPIIDRFNRVGAMSTVELAGLYDFAIADRGQYE